MRSGGSLAMVVCFEVDVVVARKELTLQAEGRGPEE